MHIYDRTRLFLQRWALPWNRWDLQWMQPRPWIFNRLVLHSMPRAVTEVEEWELQPGISCHHGKNRCQTENQSAQSFQKSQKVISPTISWQTPLSQRGFFFRSYLKNVFWPKSCVEISFQFLKILQYFCGLKLDLALTLNQNPIFEMTSIFISAFRIKRKAPNCLQSELPKAYGR